MSRSRVPLRIVESAELNGFAAEFVTVRVFETAEAEAHTLQDLPKRWSSTTSALFFFRFALDLTVCCDFGVMVGDGVGTAVSHGTRG